MEQDETIPSTASPTKQRSVAETERAGEAEDPGPPRDRTTVGPEAIRLNTSILAQQACQV